MFVFILKFLTFVNIYFYKVNVPVTVNVAIVSLPHTATVFVPGATAKLAGLQAVGNFNITTPEPPFPATPLSPTPAPPPPPPLLAVPFCPCVPPVPQGEAVLAIGPEFELPPPPPAYAVGVPEIEFVAPTPPGAIVGEPAEPTPPAPPPAPE
jgi:hypothetical protein